MKSIKSIKSIKETKKIKPVKSEVCEKCAERERRHEELMERINMRRKYREMEEKIAEASADELAMLQDLLDAKKSQVAQTTLF